MGVTADYGRSNAVDLYNGASGTTVGTGTTSLAATTSAVITTAAAAPGTTAAVTEVTSAAVATTTAAATTALAEPWSKAQLSPIVLITLTGSISEFGEGSARRAAFVSGLAAVLGINEKYIVIIYEF